MGNAPLSISFPHFFFNLDLNRRGGGGFCGGLLKGLEVGLFRSIDHFSYEN